MHFLFFWWLEDDGNLLSLRVPFCFSHQWTFHATWWALAFSVHDVTQSTQIASFGHSQVLYPSYILYNIYDES